MWNIVVGPIFRRMTGFGMRITHGVSENLYGRASIIWANRLLIILIGPAILLCSVSSTWPDCPKTVTTNYPSAEVFINGKSQGKRTKDLTVTAENSADSASIADFKRQKRYRLMWMDTKYEPGTVKVVAYNDKGEAVAEKEIHTAGKPDHIELVTDRNEIKADGKDLSFVTVRVVDKEGNLCPDAQHLIKYSVKGAGTYRAGANGDPTSLELFHVPQMKVFNGMMTAVVQSTDKPGEIILTATGKGLKSGRLVLMSK